MKSFFLKIGTGTGLCFSRPGEKTCLQVKRKHVVKTIQKRVELVLGSNIYFNEERYTVRCILEEKYYGVKIK